MKKCFDAFYITTTGINDNLYASQVKPTVSHLSKSFDLLVIAPGSRIDLGPVSKSDNLLVVPTIRFLKHISFFLFFVLYLFRYRPRIIHSRSYYPSLLALLFRPLFRYKLLFDPRGLWIDERLDINIPLYKKVLPALLTHFEPFLYKSSDYVVFLTAQHQSIVESIFGLPNIRFFSSVIPTLPSNQFFLVDKLPVSHRFDSEPLKICWLGSFCEWHDLNSTLRLLESIYSCIDLHFTLISASVMPSVLQQIGDHSSKVGYTFEALSLPHDSVPIELSQYHLGLTTNSFVFSRLASCPTRVPEMLASGLVVITDSWCGEFDQDFSTYKSGFIYNRYADDTILNSQVFRFINSFVSDPLAARECALSHSRIYNSGRFARSEYTRIYRLLLTD